MSLGGGLVMWGAQARWLSPTGGPRSTRPGPEAGATGGRCCIPPYTAWHLSYVVIGASLAPHVYPTRLWATLAAFFLAVGVAAHALDELHGRPLGTAIPSLGALGGHLGRD